MVFKAIRHREGGLGGGEVCALKFITPTLNSDKIKAEVDALLCLKGKPNIIEVNYICNDPLNIGKVSTPYTLCVQFCCDHGTR